MKLCPRRPIKVPRDFGTRLCPVSECEHPYGLIGVSSGKLYTTSDFNKRIAWYDKASKEQRLRHQIKADRYYKPIPENAVIL